MKISQEEIVSAINAYCNAYSPEPTVYPAGMRKAIEAALKVRRARKQAKRDRQRKEKNKQVVESVQWSAEELDRMKAMPITGKDPINKLPPLVGSVKGIPIERGMNETERADLERKTAEMMRYLSTLSKAPEWDGTFYLGQWQTRDGSKVVLSEVDHHPVYPFTSEDGRTYDKCGFLYGPDNETPHDLIRPWPKGEQ